MRCMRTWRMSRPAHATQQQTTRGKRTKLEVGKDQGYARSPQGTDLETLEFSKLLGVNGRSKRAKGRKTDQLA